MKQKFEIKNILGNSQKRTYRREIFKIRRSQFVLDLIIFLMVTMISRTGFGEVKITSPEVVETKIEVKAVEDTTEIKKDTGHSIPWLIDKIHLMESTRGKNGIASSLQKYCEDKGLWNEYGYGGMAKKICFKDQTEADITIIKWFEKQFKTKTESQTICYYRYGEVMPDCDYYQNIIK